MSLAEQVQRLVKRERALEAELAQVRKQLVDIRRFMGEAAVPQKAQAAKKPKTITNRRTGLADRVRGAVTAEPWLRADQIVDRIGMVASHKLHNALTTLVHAGSILRSPDRPYRYAMPDQKEAYVVQDTKTFTGRNQTAPIRAGRYLQCHAHSIREAKGCQHCSGTGWLLDDRNGLTAPASSP